MNDVLLAGVLIVAAHQTVWYVFSLIKRDSSLADLAWGSGLVVLAVALVIRNEVPALTQLIVTLLVSAGGMRLFFHLAARKKGGPEDWRYAKWRQQWGGWFAARSYLQNFLLQGLLMLLIASPLLVAAGYGDDTQITLSWWQGLGMAVWAAGFVIEAAADQQLGRFLSSKKDTNAILQSGLWRYSRHPNYFGEMLQWWGGWLIVVGLPYGLWAVISPLLISYLLIFVSGIPLLESKLNRNKSYQAYARRTSKLLPLPPQKGRQA